ncbi:hypothetical protein YC2023_117736 [Brassica napus]
MNHFSVEEDSVNKDKRFTYCPKSISIKGDNHASVVGWSRRSVDLQGTRIRIRTTPDFHSAWPPELSHSLSREMNKKKNICKEEKRGDQCQRNIPSTPWMTSKSIAVFGRPTLIKTNLIANTKAELSLGELRRSWS